MLKTDNLSITSLSGRVLLKDFSYVLNDGDKIALIGEEGNGKSTLLKVMAGEDVSAYATVSGTITCNDRIAYMPQTIEEEHLDEEAFHFISHGAYDYEKIYALSAMMYLDLNHFAGRIIRSLSGGEKVKASLARILYDDPDILLLDEPTNDLDLKTLIWLEEFIRNTRLSVLFISHDEVLLRNCAQGIIHLEQLKRKQEAVYTIANEEYDDYYERRIHKIDKTNQLARKEKSELDKQLQRYRQIYQKVEHRMATISRADPHGGQLLKKKMKALKAQGRKLDEKDEKRIRKYEPEEAIEIFFDEMSISPHKVILDLHLEKLMVEDRILSRNIDLYIEGKDKVVIIGDNGSGKTTLLKIISEKLRERNDLKVAYMPQNYQEVLDEELTPVTYLYQISEDRTAAQTLLGSLKFTYEEMDHKISELSQGQRCKILLAGLILEKPEVLILDEPSRNLSPLSGPQLRKMLKAYSGCIISVSHDRMYIDEVCDRVYELSEEGLKKID